MNYTEFAQSIKKKYPGAYDQVDDRELAQKFIEKYPTYKNQVTFDRSLRGKVWDALDVPRQKSKEGLDMIARAVPSAEPTGNLVRDLALNTPKIAAETLAEAAPQFVDRTALLTAGTGKLLGLGGKVAKPIMRGAGAQLESLSGALPGSLEAAYKDSKLIFGPGKKAAQEGYELAKATGGKVRKALSGIGDRKKFVAKALDIAKKGKLTATEALEARKELDKLRRSVSGEYFRTSRRVLDDIAKEAYAGADAGYRRALQSESLRNLMPQNKFGGTSAFKMGIMTGLEALGASDSVIAKTMARLAGASMSPAAQGVAATGAGATARQVLGPLTNLGARATAVPMAASSVPRGMSLALEYLARRRKSKKAP